MVSHTIIFTIVALRWKRGIPMTRRWRTSIITICLLILPLLSACGSQAQPQKSTVAQSSQDVTYPGVGGVTLAGTLLIPAHQQETRVPGVIIVAGSGPTDRNGNQAGGFTTDLYRQLADQLALQGIASLRYDKRGIGLSTSYPPLKNPSQPTPRRSKLFRIFSPGTTTSRMPGPR